MNIRKVVKKIPIVHGVAYFIFTMNKKGLFNPIKLFKTVAYLPKFYGDYRQLSKEAAKIGHKFHIKYMFPVYIDYSVTSINKHYWFQDIYVAQKIIDLQREKPENLHIDIGSRVEGFITSLISARVNLIFCDINLPRVPFPGASAKNLDLQDMKPEDFKDAGSVSTLHVLEHLGLGKYGDKIDPIGHKRIFTDFSRVLQPGTKLFLSSPVSNKPGLVFNAGRHLDPKEMIEDAVNNGFTVDETAIVQDDWGFDINPTDEQLYESEYGCLILSLTKK